MKFDEGGAAPGRVAILDSLRGLAALAVCLYHFAGRDGFLPDGVIPWAARFGYLGVVSFFVISGFVIPWVLYRSGYQLRGYGRFLVKRLVRLEPPYLAAVAICVALLAAYSWYKGLPFPADGDYWRRLLLHFGYLVGFTGREWFDDVYWTLGIECQYYLLMGLAFPLLVSERPWLRGGSFGLLAALTLLGPFLPVKTYLVSYLSVFLLGVAAFQFRAGIQGKRRFLLLIAGLGGLTYFCLGLPIALTAVATVCLVGFADFSHPLLDRLGTVSYSLYLFHASLGGVVINLGIKYTASPAWRYFVFVLALGVAFLFAWVMYRLIELPARRWASAIPYRRPAKVVTAAAPAAVHI
jgi:peptidoglycan/LPS O-acetylase OafA/YrhL